MAGNELTEDDSVCSGFVNALMARSHDVTRTKILQLHLPLAVARRRAVF